MSPLATAQPTQSPDGTTSTDAVAWAGGVCSAADGVEQSLDALGESLEVDLGSDEQVVDQLGPQVEAQADDVRGAVESLTSALSAVPESADPDVAAAADELQADRQSLEDSVTALREAASTLSEASDAASLARGVATVGAQFAVVRLDAETFADSLRSTAEQGTTAVKAAFVDAPECDDRV
jgi:phage-related minor tail protein